MSTKRLNLMILIGIICYIWPLVVSAQEKPSISQSSKTKTSNEETTKYKTASASKADLEKKPNPSQSGAKKPTDATKPSEKKARSAKQKRTRTQKQKNKRFVDRNGDGIHDGMEHRFRRKHQRARSSKNTDSRGRHVRQQRRKGAEGSPNKGTRGVK